MQIFKLRSDAFKEIRKQSLIRLIPLLLIGGTAGILISSANSTDGHTDVSMLLLVIPVVVLILGFGLFRGVNRQKALLDSYTLTITSNLVTREQLNTPTISIYFNEITKIVKNKKGGFIIKGTDAGDVIWIPSQIENYPQLEAALQLIQPVTLQENGPFLQRYPTLISLVTVGLMLCVYAVNNKIIVALAGTPLVVFMTWTMIKIRNNKSIDNKTKRSLVWTALVIASIIGVMFFKLTGLAGIPHL